MEGGPQGGVGADRNWTGLGAVRFPFSERRRSAPQAPGPGPALAVALLTRLQPGVLLVTRPRGARFPGERWVSESAQASCSAGADGPDGAEGPGVNVLPCVWTIRDVTQAPPFWRRTEWVTGPSHLKCGGVF